MTDLPLPHQVAGPRRWVLRLSDDATLARLAAEGDEHAFALLCRRHERLMHAQCRFILRGGSDADDAVQDALVKAFAALRRGQLRGEPRPWLLSIARNEARSLLRVRREHAELHEESSPALDGPEAVVLLRERLREVTEDLGALSDQGRRALLLRELGGFSYEEVGATLGLGPRAARQAVHEARRALRDDAAGRADPCAEVRARLAGADGRGRRARRLQGHLRGCAGCRAWAAANPPPRRRLLTSAALGVLVSQGGLWSDLMGTVAVRTTAAGGLAGTLKAAAVVGAVASGALGTAGLERRVDRATAGATEAARHVRKAASATPGTARATTAPVRAAAGAGPTTTRRLRAATAPAQALAAAARARRPTGSGDAASPTSRDPSRVNGTAHERPQAGDGDASGQPEAGSSPWRASSRSSQADGA